MKIIVPIDLSAVALNAFVYALQMAQLPEADIITLYVQPDDGLSPANEDDAAQGTDDPYSRYVQELDTIAKKKDRTGTRITHMRQQGAAAGEIAAFARSRQADCIVMGARRGHGLSHRLFGFLSEQLMDSCSCYVVAVPEDCTYREITKIILLAHLPSLGLYELKRLLRFAERFHAHVNVVELKDDFKEEDAALLNRWADRLYKAEVSFHILVCAESELMPAITGYAASNEASLVAVHAYSYNAAERIAGRDLSLQLLERLQIPLLELH